MIEVILLERVESLGQMGQVVKVRPGFARNYLLPQKKALRATQDNLAFYEKRRAELEAENAVRRDAAVKLVTKIDGLKLVIVRQAGDSGQLYGSVSARDVADALQALGYTVDKNKVLIANPIKSLGLVDIKIALHPEVVVPLTLNIARSVEEAALQAAAGKSVKKSEKTEEDSQLPSEETANDAAEKESAA